MYIYTEIQIRLIIEQIIEQNSCSISSIGWITGLSMVPK